MFLAFKEGQQISEVRGEDHVLAILDLHRARVAQQFFHGMQGFGGDLEGDVGAGRLHARGEVGMHDVRGMSESGAVACECAGHLDITAHLARPILRKLMIGQKSATLLPFDGVGQCLLKRGARMPHRAIRHGNPGAAPCRGVKALIVPLSCENPAFGNTHFVEKYLSLRQRTLADLVQRLALGHAGPIKWHDDGDPVGMTVLVKEAFAIIGSYFDQSDRGNRPVRDPGR